MFGYNDTYTNLAYLWVGGIQLAHGASRVVHYTFHSSMQLRVEGKEQVTALVPGVYPARRSARIGTWNVHIVSTSTTAMTRTLCQM